MNKFAVSRVYYKSHRGFYIHSLRYTSNAFNRTSIKVCLNDYSLSPE